MRDSCPITVQCVQLCEPIKLASQLCYYATPQQHCRQIKLTKQAYSKLSNYYLKNEPRLTFSFQTKRQLRGFKPTTITSPYCVLEKEVDATLPGNGCHVELNNGLNNRYFNLLQKVMAPIVLVVYFGNTDNVFM